MIRNRNQDSLTPAELDELRGKLAAAMTHRRHPVLKPPLPRRARFRLWRRGLIDGAAIWLVMHDRWKTAERLWRICGMRDKKGREDR